MEQWNVDLRLQRWRPPRDFDYATHYYSSISSLALMRDVGRALLRLALQHYPTRLAGLTGNVLGDWSNMKCSSAGKYEFLDLGLLRRFEKFWRRRGASGVFVTCPIDYRDQLNGQLPHGVTVVYLPVPLDPSGDPITDQARRSFAHDLMIEYHAHLLGAVVVTRDKLYDLALSSIDAVEQGYLDVNEAADFLWKVSAHSIHRLRNGQISFLPTDSPTRYLDGNGLNSRTLKWQGGWVRLFHESGISDQLLTAIGRPAPPTTASARFQAYLEGLANYKVPPLNVAVLRRELQSLTGPHNGIILRIRDDCAYVFAPDQGTYIYPGMINPSVGMVISFFANNNAVLYEFYPRSGAGAAGGRLPRQFSEVQFSTRVGPTNYARIYLIATKRGGQIHSPILSPLPIVDDQGIVPNRDGPIFIGVKWMLAPGEMMSFTAGRWLIREYRPVP